MYIYTVPLSLFGMIALLYGLAHSSDEIRNELIQKHRKEAEENEY